MMLKTCKAQSPGLAIRRRQGYLMMEALVYIGLVFLILGVGYAALYHCIDSSVALRRNADDITGALHAGERWRADVRSASSNVWAETVSGQQVLHLPGPRAEICYAFWRGAVLRRVNDGSWSTLLDHVNASTMEPDRRPYATAWRWELEIKPRGKGTISPSRIRPLFTFLAVPQTTPAP
jgi:hypothetical protein